MPDNNIAYERDVKYYETDRMGIVHHSNYIRYFEEARIDQLDKIGLPYPEIEERGIMIPVLFVECAYLKPLRYGDTFRIIPRIAKYTGLKMDISYELYHGETGELCTTGKSGHCFLYPDMKPVRMKRDFPDIYERLMEYAEKDRSDCNSGV